MKQYVCVKQWSRNQVGDVIDEWTYKRYPIELRGVCFREVAEVDPGKNSSTVVVERLPEIQDLEPVNVEPDRDTVRRIRTDVDLKVESVDLDGLDVLETPTNVGVEKIFEKKFKKNL